MSEKSGSPRAFRLSTWAGGLVLCAMLVPAHVAAPAGPAAEEAAPRDLALEGKRSLDAGRLAEAFDALAGARRRIDADGARRDPELADFLALNLYNLGVRFNNGGDAARALACFAEALALLRSRPGLRDADFRSRLADASLDLAAYAVAAGRHQEALPVYAGLADALPGDVRPLVGLGDARMAAGDPEAARTSYIRAQELQPSSAAAASGHGRTALALASPAGGDPEGIADAFGAAVDQLRLACRLDPASPEVWRDLAEGLQRSTKAFGRAGRAGEAAALRAEAEASLRRVADLRDSHPAALLDLATFVFQARRFEEAADLLARSARGFEALIEARPDDVNAGAWRSGLTLSRENRAAALYNLAVDALNTARFDRIDPLLREACAAGPAWDRTCVAFRSVASARQRAFAEAVAANEAVLSASPNAAGALLALGDLYTDVARWDEALACYTRLRRLGSDVAGLDDRIHAVTDAPPSPEVALTVEVPRGRVRVTFHDRSLGEDLATAVKAAWLRVSGALGGQVMRGDLEVTVYPNRRAFREHGGYRIGARVKGNYGSGRVSVYDAPSTGLVEWVSVLTHEMAHHAIERLSGGGLPRWLNEGVARYVEGDVAVVDRARMARRLAAGRLPPLARLDGQWEASWSDPEVIVDVRDAALLAVEEMARRGRMDGLERIVAAVGSSGGGATIESATEQILGARLQEIDDAWRARVRLSGSR